MAGECGWVDWPGFAEEAMAAMDAYGWPGNVRELRNVVERAVYAWPEPERPVGALVFDPFASPWRPVAAPVREVAAVIPSVVPDAEIADLKAAMHAHEAVILSRTLERHRFNQRATAKALSLSYDQLRHCLKKHGLLQA
jgi:psp operon transcriptional activator